MPAACGRSSGTGQMRVSNGSRCVFAYMNAHSMAFDGGGGWRRRIAGSRSRRAAMNSPRSFSVAVSDEPGLKRHVGVTEQPRLTLQPADERRQVAVVDRAPDLLHDEHLPQSELCDLRKVRFLESLDERDAVGASVDVLAELGIECDRSFQQK